MMYLYIGQYVELSGGEDSFFSMRHDSVFRRSTLREGMKLSDFTPERVETEVETVFKLKLYKD